MRAYLGIDVGGSKTHALIADKSGQVLGFGSGGPGNHQDVGYDGLCEVLNDVTHEALSAADLSIENIIGAGFGIAGYDWPSQLKAHMEVIDRLGLTCPLEMVNDAVIGLLAGASQGWGIVLVAGTGNNCRGRDQLGREGRITGEGMRFGEYGGGGEIVMKAIHAVSYEWTQRGPPTAITGKFLEFTQAEDLSALLEGIDLGRYKPEADWALAVFQAAYDGDPVAKEIIQWSSLELGTSACGVIRQLGFEDRAFEVVLVGSIFGGGELYLEPLQKSIHQVAPQAQFIYLDVPPVVGGVLLGMQQLLGKKAFQHRDNLVETTKSLLKESYEHMLLSD
jgi:N-acetylglucosamine kinase-like BadF-type ATPase